MKQKTYLFYGGMENGARKFVMKSIFSLTGWRLDEALGAKKNINAEMYKFLSYLFFNPC